MERAPRKCSVNFGGQNIRLDRETQADTLRIESK